MFSSHNRSTVVGANWYNDESIRARIQGTLAPSMISQAAYRGGGGASTPQPQQHSSIVAGGAGSAAAAALNGGNSRQQRPHSGATTRNNPLSQLSPQALESWKEPFQMLQRLIDRNHRQQLEKSLGPGHELLLSGPGTLGPAAATSSSSSSSFRRLGLGGDSVLQARLNGQSAMSVLEAQRQLYRQQQVGGGLNNNNNNSVNNNGSSLSPRIDPFSEMDQLYSKAKRKWIDLCVTMRVPEEERQLIEKQISRRDDAKQMANALSILHGEIERLVDLYKWTGILRKAIDAREAKLAAFFVFVAKFHENNNQQQQQQASAAAKRRQSQHQRQNEEDDLLNKGNPPPDNQGELCLKVLTKLLELRHAAAEVYTAHRKWQVAHGSTAPKELFVYKGTAYLEKMLHDLCSLIDTDALDVDRTIALKAHKQKQQQSSASDNSAPTSSRMLAVGSGARAVRNARGNHQRSHSPPKAANHSTSSPRGLRPTSASSNNNSSNSGSASSPRSPRSISATASSTTGGGGGGNGSAVITKLPDWLFAFVHFRVARANVLLDIRKRRVMHQARLAPSSSASLSPLTNYGSFHQHQQQRDYETCDLFRRERELISAFQQQIDHAINQTDEQLEQLVSERCGWTVDDYFHSGNNAMNEVKAAWKFAAEVLQRRVSEHCRDPAELGIVRSEFIKDLEEQCAFVLDHESSIVDKLIQRSIGGAENQLAALMSSEASSVFAMSSQPQQIRHVVMAQKYFRRFLARNKVRRMYERKVAATVIQAWFRRHLAKLEVQHMRREWRAARKIQAFYRATVVRRAIRQELRERREERERRAHQQYLDTKREKERPDPNRILIVGERTLMVSPARRMLVDRSGKTLRVYLEECATKIQAAYRGWREYERGMGPAVCEWRLFLRVNEAAAKIQSRWKGVVVRREHEAVRLILAAVKLMQRVGRGFVVRRRVMSSSLQT